MNLLSGYGASSSSAPARNSAASCWVCSGSGKQGVLGLRGLGLWTTACRACQCRTVHQQQLGTNGTSVPGSSMGGISGSGRQAQPAYAPSGLHTAPLCTSTDPAAWLTPGDSDAAPGCPEASLPTIARSSPSRIEATRSLTCIDGDEMLGLYGLGSESLMLNVYYIRGIAFDEHGRVQRTAKKLTSTRRFVKDVLGIYHVGLETHGTEYTFGNYHAKDSRRLGGDESGVVAHAARRAGPRYVFKESICLGSTAWTSAQVEEAAGQLGAKTFTANSYDKIGHNCVDFVRSLGSLLGATDLPLWCHRASSVARVINEMRAQGVAGLERVGTAAAQALPLPSSTCTQSTVDDDEVTGFEDSTAYEDASASDDSTAYEDEEPRDEEWDLMNGCKKTGAGGVVEDCKRTAGDLFQADGDVGWTVMDDELTKMGINESVNILELMHSRHPPDDSLAEANDVHPRLFGNLEVPSLPRRLAH